MFLVFILTTIAKHIGQTQCNIVSSVRSSSGYHGLIEIRSSSAATHFFKFFRFLSESKSERTQHVLYF